MFLNPIIIVILPCFLLSIFFSEVRAENKTHLSIAPDCVIDQNSISKRHIEFYQKSVCVDDFYTFRFPEIYDITVSEHKLDKDLKELLPKSYYEENNYVVSFKLEESKVKLIKEKILDIEYLPFYIISENDVLLVFNTSYDQISTEISLYPVDMDVAKEISELVNNKRVGVAH